MSALCSFSLVFERSWEIVTFGPASSIHSRGTFLHMRAGHVVSVGRCAYLCYRVRCVLVCVSVDDVWQAIVSVNLAPSLVAQGLALLQVGPRRSCMGRLVAAHLLLMILAASCRHTRVCSMALLWYSWVEWLPIGTHGASWISPSRDLESAHDVSNISLVAKSWRFLLAKSATAQRRIRVVFSELWRHGPHWIAGSLGQLDVECRRSARLPRRCAAVSLCRFVRVAVRDLKRAKRMMVRGCLEFPA